MLHKPEVGQKFLSLVTYLMVSNLNERTRKVEYDKTNEQYAILVIWEWVRLVMWLFTIKNDRKVNFYDDVIN